MRSTSSSWRSAAGAGHRCGVRAPAAVAADGGHRRATGRRSGDGVVVAPASGGHHRHRRHDRRRRRRALPRSPRCWPTCSRSSTTPCSSARSASGTPCGCSSTSPDSSSNPPPRSAWPPSSRIRARAVPRPARRHRRLRQQRRSERLPTVDRGPGLRRAHGDADVTAGPGRTDGLPTEGRPGQLRVGDVVRAALRTYRERFWRVAGHGVRRLRDRRRDGCVRDGARDRPARRRAPSGRRSPPRSPRCSRWSASSCTPASSTRSSAPTCTAIATSASARSGRCSRCAGSSPRTSSWPWRRSSAWRCSWSRAS